MELMHTATRSGRLSSFLKNELHMSSGLINRLKWAGALAVNGQSCHTDYQVTPGDRIVVSLEEPEPAYPAQDGMLDILYEDDCLLAVDKPAGMLIHPSRAQNQGTLANYVAGYYRATGQHSAFHPATRLDRDTFGIVLLGKNAHIHRLLQTGGLQKTYHALVYGTMPAESGTIDAPIARKPLPSLLREIRPDGKTSVTRYRVTWIGEEYSKVVLEPVTGRTHQLRLHCAWVGCPILGDPQYGSQASMAFSEGLGLEGQLLCAKSLRFAHPVTGEKMYLESRMDAELPR